ncbi:hypothetical protein [Spirillospora sp. NPDC029432]|uniref:hypothetical protein n=1 Tax=Spirillospora sp. NPDC029432 TaxID=3154599 RepID=UPI0034519CAE
MTTHPNSLADRVNRAAGDAVSDAIAAQMLPALRRAGMDERQAREFVWRPAEDWRVGGPGPVRLEARVAAGRGYDEVRELVAEFAGRFGRAALTVKGSVPADAIVTVEAAVDVEGVPVTVWGVIAHRDQAPAASCAAAPAAEASATKPTPAGAATGTFVPDGGAPTSGRIRVRQGGSASKHD